jgi:hypothetical protein
MVSFSKNRDIACLFLYLVLKVYQTIGLCSSTALTKVLIALKGVNRALDNNQLVNSYKYSTVYE